MLHSKSGGGMGGRRMLDDTRVSAGVVVWRQGGCCGCVVCTKALYPLMGWTITSAASLKGGAALSKYARVRWPERDVTVMVVAYLLPDRKTEGGGPTAPTASSCRSCPRLRSATSAAAQGAAATRPSARKRCRSFAG